MARFGLRRDVGAGLLAADLFVLYFALSAALDYESPPLYRLISFAVTGVAVALGAHSLFHVLRRRRRADVR